MIIDTAAGKPLRLNDGPYPFGEIPEGGIGTTSADRLAFLCSHLADLCDLWAKRPRQFVDLYFRFICAQIERDAAEIDQRLVRLGGLFARQDYAFSALRPLPRAHLPVAEDDFVRVDFGFWTGNRFIAVDIVGDDARGAVWGSRRRRLADAGIQAMEVAAAAIARDDPGILGALLPGEFAAFWQAEAMPSSPFKARALDEPRRGVPEF